MSDREATPEDVAEMQAAIEEFCRPGSRCDACGGLNRDHYMNAPCPTPQWETLSEMQARSAHIAAAIARSQAKKD